MRPSPVFGTPTASQRVAVMGGSIGGLNAALWLRDMGYDVDVFERSSGALEARGAGIAVLDDTVRYFLEHGTVDLDQIITATHWVRYLRKDKTPQYEEPRYYRFSSWNTIYRTLLSCLPAEHYRLGKQVDCFTQDADQVDVSFTDGTSTTCSLLVAADGIDSTARRVLLPDIEPQYAGYVAWRGTVSEAALTPETVQVLGDSIAYQLLENSHIVMYPIPNLDGAVKAGERLMNFVWYRNVTDGQPLKQLLTDREGRRRSVSLPPGAVRDESVDEMQAFARARLSRPIAEVVLKTEQPFIQIVVDVEVPRMRSGRVCLIGDAAFAVRPHPGAGTAKAARDAWALAQALAAAEGDVARALEYWEHTQLTLGRQLLWRAREIGDSSQFAGTWTPGDPKLVFGLHRPGH